MRGLEDTAFYDAAEAAAAAAIMAGNSGKRWEAAGRCNNNSKIVDVSQTNMSGLEGELSAEALKSMFR